MNQLEFSRPAGLREEVEHYVHYVIDADVGIGQILVGASNDQ